MKHVFSVLGLSVAALLTACGGGSGNGATATVNNAPIAGFTATPFSGGFVDTASVNSSSGTLANVFVTTTNNRTIYIYDADVGQTTPQCTTGTGCLGTWPAVTVPAGMTVAAPFGTTLNSGTLQLTYELHPLYTFSGDTAAGVANGQGEPVGSSFFYAATPTLSSTTLVPTY
jgi:predicted lipoprotein with Yx(FWY)xxD motif